jgi:solute carrier family 10 (sodium/bile acid cotransporter), member 7
MLAKIFPDRLVPILLLVLLAASLFPVHGAGLPIANAISTIAFILLFFMNGVRLPRHEVIAGIRNIRLQGGIFFFCFGVMSAVGVAAQAIAQPWLPSAVALGFLYMGVLPSTVQSATASTSLAGGNVAASVVAAGILNISGVFLSPLIFAALAGGAGDIHADGVMRIISILLLPFIAGQFAQKWLRPWALANKPLVTLMDRTTICIAVYVAFSAAVMAGIWDKLQAQELVIIGSMICALMVFAFGGGWWLGKRLGLPRGDRISMFFACGQKSIAFGAPLAATLFPPAVAGMVLVPILIYHTLQLVISAWIAPQLARKSA